MSVFVSFFDLKATSVPFLEMIVNPAWGRLRLREWRGPQGQGLRGEPPLALALLGCMRLALPTKSPEAESLLGVK